MRRIAIIWFISLSFIQDANSQLVSLRGKWKFSIGDQQGWANPRFDDSGWETIWAPAAWEDEGFYGYDGFAWYRKKVNGNMIPKNERIYLDLGYIDDADEVYFNGELIGFSGSMPPKFKTAYNANRNYIIPSNLINYSGDNVIAIRVFDAMQAGGILDGELGVYRLESRSPMVIDLQGLWSFALSHKGDPIREKAAWDKIMVPGHWEKQGYRHYDGFAWYRTTFELPANRDKSDLVLILGKIDDFDEVYINGELIGATNDHRRYGRSYSYEQFRAYDIPGYVLKDKGPNSIEILVQDIGNVGGIYEGPIGITSKSRYYRHFR